MNWLLEILILMLVGFAAIGWQVRQCSIINNQRNKGKHHPKQKQTNQVNHTQNTAEKKTNRTIFSTFYLPLHQKTLFAAKPKHRLQQTGQFNATAKPELHKITQIVPTLKQQFDKTTLFVATPKQKLCHTALFAPTAEHGLKQITQFISTRAQVLQQTAFFSFSIFKLIKSTIIWKQPGNICKISF
jgi:hypothetical protein